MKFNVTIERYGFVEIDAETEAEAIEQANNCSEDDISWSENWEAVGASEANEDSEEN